MADRRRKDLLLPILYGLLLAAGLVLTIWGVVVFIQDRDLTPLGLGVLAVIVPAALYPVAAGIYRNAGSDAEKWEEARQLLHSIDECQRLSERAKQAASRKVDRESLREAINADMEQGDFDSALILADQMGRVFGNREEAEAFRSNIIEARSAEMEQKIAVAIARLEELLAGHDWDSATSEAARIQRLFPDTTAVSDLQRRVEEARARRKKDLERDFLAAAQRDDVDRAMNLMKDLDKYLTESEAEPFRETARGVITKAKQNLGVQFKLAVHDKEWTESLRVGDQIIREFPNTRMADEVRGMLDLLRQRAAGEQAVRSREFA